MSCGGNSSLRAEVEDMTLMNKLGKKILVATLMSAASCLSPELSAKEPVNPYSPNPDMITLDEIDNAQWKPDKIWIYKKVDGVELPMAVFYPPGHKPTDRRPTVVVIHGGAWSGGKAEPGPVMYPHARYFASRGAVAFSIEYRHVPRPILKEKVGKEIKKVPNPEFETGPDVFNLLADCKSALRHIRSNAHLHGVDPNRIAALGDSAGGHLAAALGTIKGFDEPGDDLSINGMANATIACNAIMDLANTNWLNFVPTTPRSWEKEKILTREERAKLISPLYNVCKDSVPSLVMHGQLDLGVRPKHSTDFQKKMSALGKRCDIHILPDATHAFILLGYKATYRQIITAMTKADQFLVSLGYLEGKATLKAPKGVADKEMVARFSAETARDGYLYDAISPERFLSLPSSRKEGSSPKPLEIVEDEQRGKVIKVYSHRHGALTSPDFTGMGHQSTIAMWAKIDNNRGLIARRTGGFGTAALGYSITLHNKDGVSVNVGGTQVCKENGATSIVPNKWIHIACTMGEGTVTIYIDGKEIVHEDGLDFSLSGGKLGLAGFSGHVDDVHIYNYALCQGEVQHLLK